MKKISKIFEPPFIIFFLDVKVLKYIGFLLVCIPLCLSLMIQYSNPAVLNSFQVPFKYRSAGFHPSEINCIHHT